MTNSVPKIMIAYDGSHFGDTAIADLSRAGLPAHGNALVVSVIDIADTAISSPAELGALGKFLSPSLLAETVEFTQVETERLLEEGRALAVSGGYAFLEHLPDWDVFSRSIVGNPADELLNAAKEWQPDMIVVGSNGRGQIGRFFLGSVSKRIAEEATSSVRVSRPASNSFLSLPSKIVIGADAAGDAEILSEVVISREWANDIEFHLIVARDSAANKTQSERVIERLKTTGRRAALTVIDGELRSALLEISADAETQSIFALANDYADNGSGLGQLAASLVTSARCTIEIVRPRRAEQRRTDVSRLN